MPMRDTLLPLAYSRTLARVALYALAMGAYSLLAVGKEYSAYSTLGDFPAQIHAALTLVLGWLLVFRTNAAYARWWEARTLWGTLVNASRNLAIKLFHLVDPPNGSRERLEKLLISFPRALRDHLRRQPPEPEIGTLVGSGQDGQHIPVALATRLYDEIAQLRKQSKIDGDELRVIDLEARVWLEVCGACERILNTRVVRSYRTFARQCVMLYLFTFPWGIVETFRWWTVPLTVITSYFMLGLETVAEHIEEPFGFDEDDLNLDAICEGIENTVRQIATRER
jgi:putative membrane protein